MENFLETCYFGNSGWTYLKILIVLLIAVGGGRFISLWLARFIHFGIRRMRTDIPSSEFYAMVCRPFEFFILVSGFTYAVTCLNISGIWDQEEHSEKNIFRLVERIYYTATIITLTWIAFRAVDFFAYAFRRRSSHTATRLDDTLLPLASQALKVVLIIFSGLFCLHSVYHVNITSLLAGVGIGGLAIAFAAQDSIANLFGSFTILTDKPFVVGDQVRIGHVEGVVEVVGFRSTRIRTADRTLVAIPNKQITEKELDNFSARTSRRLEFVFSMAYGTSASQIRKIMDEIKNFVDHLPELSEESIVRFQDISEKGLNIFVRCYIKNTEIESFFQTREKINFSVLEITERNKALFGYPARSVYLHTGNPVNIQT